MTVELMGPLLKGFFKSDCFIVLSMLVLLHPLLGDLVDSSSIFILYICELSLVLG